jgi:hypothetical protein
MEQAASVRAPIGASRRSNKKHDHVRCGKPMETLMHYVRVLNSMKSRAPVSSKAIMADSGADPSASVAWRCSGCDTLVPHSLEPPDTCPCCGAARQDLTRGGS